MVALSHKPQRLEEYFRLLFLGLLTARDALGDERESQRGAFEGFVCEYTKATQSPPPFHRCSRCRDLQ